MQCHEKLRLGSRTHAGRRAGIPLELESLEKAVVAFGAVLAKSEDAAFMDGLDDVARNAVKAAVIQHFEFTYERCWKFIRRWLH